MKKSIGFYAIILVAVFMMVFSSGCDTITSLFGKDDSKETKTDESLERDSKGQLSKSDRDKVSKLIQEFYKKMYENPIEKFNNTAVIPENIKEFIAERTKTEGSNNPEVGIHLPRYVELNGVTVTGMELLENGNEGSVVPTYIGKSSDSYLFYVKVHIKAKCVPDDVFDQSYKRNAATGVYELSAPVNAQQEDYIRIIEKYDVEVIKDGGEYKILRAKEASTRPGFQNRLMLLNNEFVERLPYINIEKTADKKDYINKEDGKQYDKEKEVIETFFNNIKEIDSDRMNLMKAKWRIGQNEFTDFITNVVKINADKNKNNIIDIAADYRDKFSLDSFPLQSNMAKIVEFSGFNVIPHPAYSQKQKIYIVTMNANVEKAIGIIGQKSTYSYDYYLTLSGEGDSVKVSGIYLNSCTFVS